MKDEKIDAIMDKLAPPPCGIGFRYYGTSPVEACERERGHAGPHSTRQGPPAGFKAYPWMHELDRQEHARFFQ